MVIVGFIHDRIYIIKINPMEIFGVLVNPIAIALAAFINIIIGILWYSTLLFGNYWLKLINKKKEDLEMKPLDILSSIISAVLVATGLNSVLQYSLILSGLNIWVNAVLTSFMITATLVAPAMYNSVIYEGKSKKLFLLNITHKLVELIAMSLVLSLFFVR